MKLFCFTALCSLLFVTTSFAQMPGVVGVYADAGATNCYVVDDGEVLSVHMLHVLTDGAKAVQFKLDVSATGWIHLGDNWDFELILGSSVEGVAIAYTECLSGSIYLGKAVFVGSNAAACTEISTVPDPPYEIIKAVSCLDEPMIPTGGRALVNADGTCQCTVPVQNTTWGGIKAMYQ
jgi:hypothetical protein